MYRMVTVRWRILDSLSVFWRKSRSMKAKKSERIVRVRQFFLHNGLVIKEFEKNVKGMYVCEPTKGTKQKMSHCHPSWGEVCRKFDSPYIIV